MFGYLLIVLAVLAGFLTGYLTEGGRRAAGGRLEGQINTAEPVARPESEPLAQVQETGRAPTVTVPAIPAAEAASDAEVARAVLDVADHLSNSELTRRLVEAVVRLPDVSPVRPAPGDKYQPRLHEWAGNRATDEEMQWNTIAEMLTPGAVTAKQELLRPAHVIVFEPPEQS